LKSAEDETAELEPQLTKKKLQITVEKKAAKSAVDALRRAESQLQGVEADRMQVTIRIRAIHSIIPIDYVLSSEYIV